MREPETEREREDGGYFIDPQLPPICWTESVYLQVKPTTFEIREVHLASLFGDLSCRPSLYTVNVVST